MAFSYKALGTTGFSSVLIAAFNLATGVLIARLLGPTGRGELLSAMVYPSLVASIGVALTQPVITRRSAGLTGGLSHRRINGLSLASAALLAPFLVLATVITLRVASSDVFTPRFHREYLYAIAWIPISIFSLHLLAIDWGRPDWVRFNIFRGILYPVHLVGLVVLWVTGIVDVGTVLSLYVVSNLFLLIVQLSATLPGASPIFPGPRELGAFFREGFPYIMTRSAGAFLVTIDQLVATYFLGPADRGQYAVALRVATSLTIISGAIGFVAFSDGTREAGNSEDNFQIRHRVIVGVLIAASIVLIPLAWYLIPVVFGPNFSDARLPSLLMILGGFFIALATILEQRMEGQGKTNPTAISRVAGVFGICLPPFLFGKEFSLTLLAFGFTAGNITRYMMCLYFVYRFDHVKPSNLIVPRTADMVAVYRLAAGTRGLKKSELFGANE